MAVSIPWVADYLCCISYAASDAACDGGGHDDPHDGRATCAAPDSAGDGVADNGVAVADNADTRCTGRDGDGASGTWA